MALEFDDLEVEKALEVALQLHNSVPHSATGVSPYSSMFGFEPTFPGWQHLRQDDATSRGITREEVVYHMSKRVPQLVARNRADSPHAGVYPTRWWR